ncbi:MAG: hypothetical protein LUE86_12190 [Clostridiales bacterium]|nr:hypothetical protein [Clostridiales bacterium]
MIEKIGAMRVSTKTMKKTQAAKVGAEEIQRTADFCDETCQALYRLKILRRDGDDEKEDGRLIEIRYLETRKAKAAYEYERELIQNGINRLQGCIDDDKKRVSLFRWLVGMLPEKEKLVITQLYGEDRPWRYVFDEDGRQLAQGSVEYGKNNGLALMAVEIGKRDLWAEIEALKGEDGD